MSRDGVCLGMTYSNTKINTVRGLCTLVCLTTSSYLYVLMCEKYFLFLMTSIFMAGESARIGQPPRCSKEKDYWQ
jgi:hypothetical protein